MEKLVAEETNKKVVSSSRSNCIPEDLVFSILSKLPLKPLKRFGCVCKSWSLLFENPNFMTMFRNNFISSCRYEDDDASLLLHVPAQHYADQDPLYSLSGERLQNMVKLDWPNPELQEDEFPPIFKFHGSVSVDGICCLYSVDDRHALWNPVTKEFKFLPLSPFQSLPDAVALLHGFGYNCVRDDYNVIRFVIFPAEEDPFERYPPRFPLDFERSLGGDDISTPPTAPLWEIYSLRTNSWRKLDVDIPNNYQAIQRLNVYMDGVCHWLAEGDNPDFEVRLISFDFNNEVFFNTPMPSDDIDGNFDLPGPWRHLVVLNGSIAFISYQKQMTTFHISILGKLGGNESWIKLLIVGPLPCVEQPFGVRKKAEIFFKRKDGELAWFDLSTQMIVELGVKQTTNFGSQIVIYKESLLPIGVINS